MRERKKPDYGFGFCRECGAQYKRGGATAKYCAPCAKEKHYAYYVEHREKVLEQQHAYRATHREKVAACKRAYREAHRDELAKKSRAYYVEHLEKALERQRAYSAAHREERAAKKRARKQIAGLLKLMVAADAVRRVMDVQQQQTKG